MRKAAFALVFAACFGRHDVVGSRCDATHPCPDELYCLAAGICSTTPEATGGGAGGGSTGGGVTGGGGATGGGSTAGGAGGGAVPDAGRQFGELCDAGLQCAGAVCLDAHCSGKAGQLSGDFHGSLDMTLFRTIETDGPCISFDDAGIRLTVSPAVPTCQLKSRFPVDLSNSSFTVTVDPRGVNDTGAIPEYELQAHGVDNTVLVWLGGPVTTQVRIVDDAGVQNLGIYPGKAAMLRLREDAGTVYFDLAPLDGGALQTFASHASQTFDLRRMYFVFVMSKINSTQTQSAAVGSLNR